MYNRISVHLRDRVLIWADTIENNVGKIANIRKPALYNVISEMRNFIDEDKFTIMFYDDAKKEPCPKCNYELGRVYQWLGRWYFMCRNCAHGIPGPVLVDWGKYGDLNKERVKEEE